MGKKNNSRKNVGKLFPKSSKLLILNVRDKP